MGLRNLFSSSEARDHRMEVFNDLVPPSTNELHRASVVVGNNIEHSRDVLISRYVFIHTFLHEFFFVFVFLSD